MNKLQLYITKSTRSFKSLMNFNPAEDVSRYVCDVREALQAVDYDATEKNIFYLLRYEDEGTMVVVLRTIPDRPLDHLAAWIYVANGLKIPAEELEEVVRATTRKVSSPGMSEADVNELRQLFSKEYALDRDEASMVGMCGKEYAYAMFGSGRRPLTDYLGRGRFQPALLGYKGVVLIEDGLGLRGLGTDVTDEALAEIVAMLPPENVAGGLVPFIYDRPFDRAFKVALGGNIAVWWHRQGFEPQEQIVTVSRAGMRPETPMTDDSRKMITPASFMITSQTTREPLTGCTIKVNGTEITGEHPFTRTELAQAHVWISADGYVPYSSRMDLSAVTQALVQMQEKSKVYRFELPLNSSDFGGPIEFEVRTKKDLKGSPVEGYEVLDNLQEGASRTNHLGYKGSATMPAWYKAVYFAAGAVVGIVLMALLSRCGGSPAESAPEPEKVSVATEMPAAKTPAPTAPATTPTAAPKDEATPATTANSGSTDDRAAIAYLDSTKKWDRNKMESYPLLKGLWDDMNSYNLTAIRDSWSKKLEASANFKSVLAATRQSVNKKVKLDRNPAHTPTYNKAADKVIGIVGWTYYVDP